MKPSQAMADYSFHFAIGCVKEKVLFRCHDYVNFFSGNRGLGFGKIRRNHLEPVGGRRVATKMRRLSGNFLCKPIFQKDTNDDGNVKPLASNQHPRMSAFAMRCFFRKQAVIGPFCFVEKTIIYSAYLLQGLTTDDHCITTWPFKLFPNDVLVIMLIVLAC